MPSHTRLRRTDEYRKNNHGCCMPPYLTWLMIWLSSGARSSPLSSRYSPPCSSLRKSTASSLQVCGSIVSIYNISGLIKSLLKNNKWHDTIMVIFRENIRKCQCKLYIPLIHHSLACNVGDFQVLWRSHVSSWSVFFSMQITHFK